ncbi:MAG: twin-arginine translocase TatA/TatE family subunit [Gammaproteobacteria bacterium]
MGLGGISIWQLLIILVIVVLLFGTKRLGSLGSDLGSAIRGFRKSMQGDEDKSKDEESARITDKASSQVIDGEVHRSEEKR